MYYIYKITNKLDNRVYIGQTSQNPNKRWSNHKSNTLKSKPTQYIHRAMIKYGIDNFTFEVIFCSLSQENINWAEDHFIEEQYNSRDKKFGYNIKPGGKASSPSEETKQKLSKATFKQIAEKGHPAKGTKRTDEQRAKLSAIQQAKDNDAIYTPEVRKRMSESHKGYKPSEESIKKRVESTKITKDKNRNLMIESGKLKCNAPGCEVLGQAEYLIVNEVRYCSKHGQRLKLTGSLELKTNPNKSIPMPADRKEKMILSKLGISKEENERQENLFVELYSSGLSIVKISKQTDASENRIKRILRERHIPLRFPKSRN